MQRIEPKVESTHKAENITKKWTIDDSSEVYGINRWSEGFFNINDKGNVAITPFENKEINVDFCQIVESAISRGIRLPILFKFTNILQNMVNKINFCFKEAIKNYEYKGDYILAYPIKVNQQQQVISNIVNCGENSNVGLEAGSKAELVIALSSSKSRDSLILCNGYKDSQFIALALEFSKIHNNLFIIIEKFSELTEIIRLSKSLNVMPNLGMRVKLTASGSGKWEASGGDRSKFGLFVSEFIDAIDLLKENNMLSCFKMLHSHIGSQITAIRKIKEALNEVMRIYVEVAKLGISLKYINVGGGLGVDYDGSKSNFPSSTNYTIQEYANDVVYTALEACDKSGLDHPTIISESGRASVAHHAVLVFDIFGSSELGNKHIKPEENEKKHDSINDLINIDKILSRKNYLESFHDAVQLKEETLTLFKMGYLSLKEKAEVENLFWKICRKIQTILCKLNYVPDEFTHFKKTLADTYFANFSLFQSMPDNWAISQLFPIMPIHRLNERPTKEAIIADITCDSDGRVDKFIDLRDVQDTLPVHELRPNEKYFIGSFLVGAYQETLGDLHNLFGDTNVVHVGISEKGQFFVEKVIKGDTIEELLAFMEYNKRELLGNIRGHLEGALREDKITLTDTALLTALFEQIIQGTSYMDSNISIEPLKSNY